MLGLGCITSPCCTPLILPLGFSLFAGTPVALWVSVNLGWVYGGLTILSIPSLALGIRWMWQKNEINGKASVPTLQDTLK